MLFNSFQFILFLLLALLVSAFLSRRYVPLFLLCSSYIFYASWNLNFVPLLLGTTVLDFIVCRSLLVNEKASRRKQLLALSIAGNLGVLAFFKYGAFFWENFLSVPYNTLTGQSATFFSIALPVGISFYTFQSMGHSIDVYRRKFTERIGFVDFALYVSFFPQLVAGPILRGADFFPQLVRLRAKKCDIWGGLDLILIGFTKKIVFADNLAIYVDSVFGGLHEHSLIEVVLASYAFAIQIYCDFSGYTDIARGVAKWLGFEIPINFNYPYFSQSIIEFWRRWHISLSNWLRDYLYFSLGGNRQGLALTYRNLIITMLLGGFWHGAAWNYLCWGGYHGVLLVIAHRYWNKEETSDLLKKVMRIVVTFNMVSVGWFLFRIESLQDLSRLNLNLGIGFQDLNIVFSTLSLMLLFFFIHLGRYWSGARLIDKRRPLVYQVFIIAFNLFILLLCGAPSSSFIYFQF